MDVKVGEPLTELTKENFYSYIEASDKLVVVDFYTDWCVEELGIGTDERGGEGRCIGGR